MQITPGQVLPIKDSIAIVDHANRNDDTFFDFDVQLFLEYGGKAHVHVLKYLATRDSQRTGKPIR